MKNTQKKGTVKFFNGKQIPLEMHKVCIVQSLKLVPVERSLEAIGQAGYNSFLLGTKDIFLDMLIDSGNNAMSDEQLSKMFVADDAYAGSQSFVKFQKSVSDVFEKNFILPVHLGLPVIMPTGALGCHVDAQQFLSHIPQSEYPAGALGAAIYIISGIRGMERGTMSSIRDENGVDILADLELMRLAFPRRVFTLSQVEYLIDILSWLYHIRNLVGGIMFVEEPPVLRFFTGRLEPIGQWPEKLVAKFKADFGES